MGEQMEPEQTVGTDTDAGKPDSAAPETPDTSQDSAGNETEKWKALARKHEAAAKQNAAAAKRLAELEDSQKSETQKLTDAVTTEKQRAEAAEAELARLKVAIRHGITDPADLELLGNGTEEQLEGRAKRLAELRGTAEQRVPSFDGGARQQAPAKADMNGLIRAAAGR